MNSAANTPAAIALAALAVLIALVAYAYRTQGSEGFFTEYAREEPTRSYVPYAGTVPLGEWGAGIQPWAEVIPAPPYAWRTMPWIDRTPMTPGGPLL